jgi:protein NRD1
MSFTTSLPNHFPFLPQNDMELVLVLFKTHKGLAPSQKVSSLYVFDALVRAAHSHVVKHSVVADSAPGKGNAATFLAKIEGIVEGLFEDMMSSGASGAEVSSFFQCP